MERELDALGVRGSRQPGAIEFEASIAQGATLTRRARTPTRLLLTIAEGPAVHARQLADLIGSTDWTPFLRRDTTVKLHITTRDSKLRFKDRIQRTAERALKGVQRRLPPGPSADQRLHIRLADDRARLALDAGGELLHRRGWRQDTGKAPLRENLAACLLFAAGYTGDEVLLDPFCGVGTIPIEAALLASGRSAFSDREMAWRSWHGVSDLPVAPPPAMTAPCAIIGSDKSETAIGRAQANAGRAAADVRWQTSDIAELEPPAPSGLIVTNPPYGRRLGQSVDGVYRAFGRTLRARFDGWRVLFLCPNRALAGLVDQRAERLTTFSNGGARVGIWVLGA